MTITAEKVLRKGNLLTAEAAVRRLERTEPLRAVPLEAGARFRVGDGWREGPASSDEMDPADAWVSVSGREFQLTRGALLQSASAVGIQKAYLRNTPGALTEPHLDYWWGDGIGKKQYKLLCRDNVVLAVCKENVGFFSNLRLFEETVSSIESFYGVAASDVLVDRRFVHDLRRTHMRLIVPEVARRIRSQRDSDVKADDWSVGVQICNSLTGEEVTSVKGYLFSWWCDNGCTHDVASSGAWSRRVNDDSDVYDWARAAVDEVLGGLEYELDAVESLVDIPARDHVVSTVEGLFERYRIPAGVRSDIVNALSESGDLSMYGIMQAVTQAANEENMSHSTRNKIFAAGGRIAYDYGSNARLVFESVAPGENLDLQGEVVITAHDRAIPTRISKLPAS